tara:strand:- start:1045 stop:1719 length:675 start_codon:yes stop_codon:yes gene_type:complete
MDMPRWSFSSLKTFEQCPKKYYHLKVAQDVEDPPGTAAKYGLLMHSAAEEYVRDGTELPKAFKYLKKPLDALMNIPGDKHCEIKLGIKLDENNEPQPCDFDDPDYWWHGIADLVIVNGSLAHSVDYKSSKNARYADIRQLDILAAALFLHYPDIKTVKSALAFLVSEELVPKKHEAHKIKEYLGLFTPSMDRLAGAFETDMWNPNTGPLCGYCPVDFCKHNRSK